MDLNAAYDLLLKLTKSTDNARIFKETYLHFHKPDDYDLKAYLEFITENCESWFDLLPEKLSSEPALSKPKSAILKLMSQPDVRACLGADFCSTVEEALVTTWRDIKDDLVKKRKSVHSRTNMSEDGADGHHADATHEPRADTQAQEPSNPDDANIRIQAIKDLFKSFVKCSKPEMVEFMGKVIDGL